MWQRNMELGGGGAAAAAAAPAPCQRKGPELPAPAPHCRPAFLPSFLAFMQRQWQADGAESVRLGEGAGSGRDWGSGGMACGGDWWVDGVRWWVDKGGEFGTSRDADTDGGEFSIDQIGRDARGTAGEEKNWRRLKNLVIGKGKKKNDTPRFNVTRFFMTYDDLETKFAK